MLHKKDRHVGVRAGQIGGVWWAVGSFIFFSLRGSPDGADG
jgi:hypothetical protein